MMNAKINLICYFASFITAFFTRKILLDNLGAEFIGFTGTVGSLLSFLNLAELGIGTAISYVLYKPIADGDKFKINEVISVLGYLYRIIGLAILSLGILGSVFLPLIFPNTTLSWTVIYFGYYAYLASSLIGYFVNYKATLLSADQRNYIVTGYFQLTMTSRVVLQMFLALYFKSFILYFFIELFGGIVNSIILNWKINKVYPWLKSEIKLGKQLFKKYHEIGKYTKQLFAHKVGEAIQTQMTPVLIYSFVSLPVVALYTNYTILTQKIEGLVLNAINSSGAAIGNLIAEGNKERILKVFRELLALRFFIATIVGTCIYEFASQFIGVWLGGEYILDNITVVFIAIMSTLRIANGVPAQFLIGYGLFADVWAPLAEGAILIIFAIAGGYTWGLPGVLLGPLVSTIIIISIWKPYYLFSKGFKISVCKYWRTVLVHTASAIIAFTISHYLYNSTIRPRITFTSWTELITVGFLVAITMTLLTFISFYVTSKGFRDIVGRTTIFSRLQRYRKRL